MIHPDLTFAGLLLGGLHNHQEEQQQDHQLVPPHADEENILYAILKVVMVMRRW